MVRFAIKRKYLSGVAIFASALAVILASMTTPIYAASITMLSPSSGPVGTVVSVSGSAFNSFASISFTYDGAPVSSSPCNANVLGAFSGCSFIVPSSTAGPHTVIASDGANSASATFTVTPFITLSPTSGPVGTVVTVSGSGFKASASITFTYDGAALTSPLCATDATGSFSGCSFNVPASTAGSHTVAASDGTNSASAAYTVTPSIILKPSGGPTGTADFVSGSGFKASASISFTYDGLAVTSSKCVTDASGSFFGTSGAFFTCSFQVPASTAGSHTVAASDGANSATAFYTVVPSIGLSPSSGPVGTVVKVVGSGFKASAGITFTFDGAPVTATSCSTDATGFFSGCTFTVPAATEGSHTVGASDGTNSASANFFVTPAISLSPAMGPVGTLVTVSGSNFKASASITVTFNPIMFTCATDAAGNIKPGCAFTVPASTAGGYQVAAFDGTGSATATFTVVAAISLSPTSGGVGSTVTVSGSGFISLSSMTVTFDGVLVSNTCASDSGGNIKMGCTFTVPSTSSGSHAVTASDGRIFARAFFTVVPAITLSPTSGPVGTKVTMSGSGFKAAAGISATYDMAALTLSSCMTDATGSFSGCAFTVPASTAGSHTVIASDGANSASATFTVTPVITLSPTSGSVRTVVTVSGSGFKASASITITYDMAAVSSMCATDPSGSIMPMCTFTVPSSTAGSHIVGVSDGTNSATAAFRVFPSITLVPTSGPVGTIVTVSGSGFAGSVLLFFPVTITFTYDMGAVSASSCKTDAGGSFSGCTFTVPASTAGSHTVAASDGAMNSATATFTVVPSITLSPTSGPVGTIVTVSGSGFRTSADPTFPVTITFTYDMGAVSASSCKTDIRGSFSGCTFTVPASTVGSHTVAASDGSNSASANFLVTPAISLAPAMGPVGTLVTVSGSNFKTSASITVTFDMTIVATTCSTDAAGNIRPGCTFTVPASPAGSHAVLAGDGVNSASAAFAVTPSISLTPSSGQVGNMVNVLGSGFSTSAPMTITFGMASVSSTCKTDPAGNIQPGCTFAVPASTAGFHIVGGSDSINSATATFLVTPAISLSTSSGSIGTPVMVSGSGFNPKAGMSFHYLLFGHSNQVSSTCTTDDTGSFSGCTFTVPALTPGAATVSASDGTNSATAPFTITANSTTTTVSCTPSPVNKGAPTTCTATVSPSSANGTITWTSSASGTFSTNSCTLSSGACSTSFVPSTTSPTTITASYSGDANNLPSQGSSPLTVQSAAPEFPVPLYLAIIVTHGLLLSKLLRRRVVARTRRLPL